MKQIITLLLIILVSMSVNGQITKQEFENLQAYKFFKPVKKEQKKFKDFQSPDFKFNSNKNIYAKSSTFEKKTLDSVINQEWDDDFNLWRKGFKEEFIYDGQHIGTRFLSFWNYNTSNWESFQKEEYTFDSNENVLSEIRSNQYTPTVWVFGNKTEYTYNADGNLILEINFTWESTKWVPAYKNELTYNSANFLLLELGYEWNLGTNQWMNMINHEYIRDPALLDYEIISYWDNATNQWDFISKWEYSRGDFHIWVPDFVILYRRDINNIEWVYESKYEYEYSLGPDTFPIFEKETGFTWDTSINDWKFYYKDEYQYDNHGNRTTGSYFDWSETRNEWIEYGKDEFVFDLDYDFHSDLIVPFNYDDEIDDTIFVFNNMIIGYLWFDYVNQIREDSMRTLFYYSDYTNQLSVDDEILSGSINVYPNPVSDILVIESIMPLKGVEIYSILGKKVMDIHTNFKSIPMYNIPNGIYIVKIQSDNSEMVKKIIKSN